MIYCGYQGCGKSTYCKAHPERAYDLDSSCIKDKGEGWEKRYIAMALHHQNFFGVDVFISAHQCVIKTLMEHNIPFKVFVPAHDKEAWRHRLAFRYECTPTQPNYNALADFDKNFENDMAFYDTLPIEKIHRVTAKVVTDLNTFLT